METEETRTEGAVTRKIEEPTNDDGVERHPAFGLIGVTRTSRTPPGASLFDSDVRHQHYVTVTIRTAARQRNLNHDRVHGDKQLVEVAMSEAQWASFVSSVGVGDGVPCTIQAREDDRQVPGLPYAPRLQESMTETRTAADRALAAVRAAFEAYKEHKTAANLRSLGAAISNAAPNVEFAARSLSEHAENVVQKARADIEAMVTARAEQLNINRADVLELTEG